MSAISTSVTCQSVSPGPPKSRRRRRPKATQVVTRYQGQSNPSKKRLQLQRQYEAFRHQQHFDRLDAIYILYRSGLSTVAISQITRVKKSVVTTTIHRYESAEIVLADRSPPTHPYWSMDTTAKASVLCSIYDTLPPYNQDGSSALVDTFRFDEHVQYYPSPCNSDPLLEHTYSTYSPQPLCSISF